MFWEKVKKKIEDAIRGAKAFDDCVSNYGKDDDYDIDVKIARHNYETYQNDLKQRQQNLIKKWCEEIREASSEGKKFILTDQFMMGDDKNKILWLINGGCAREFPSDASLQYFQQYFEERGFKVIRIEYQKNICCLKIIWISSDNNKIKVDEV